MHKRTFTVLSLVVPAVLTIWMINQYHATRKLAEIKRYQYLHSSLKVGLLNLNGRVLVSPRFSTISKIHNGCAIARPWELSTEVPGLQSENYSPCDWHDCVFDSVLIRKDGSVIRSIRQTALKARLDNAAQYSNLAIEAPGGCSIIGYDGQPVAGPFDKCLAMSDDLIIVQKGESVYLLIPGRLLKRLPSVIGASSGTSSKLISVRTEHGSGAIDRQGNFVILPRFLDVACEREGLVPVEIGAASINRQIWQLYGLDGKPRIPGRFSIVRSVVEGLIAVGVEKDGKQKMGIIDRCGHWVLSPTFEQVNLCSRELAIVENQSEGVRICQIQRHKFGRPYKSIMYVGNNLFAFKTDSSREACWGLVNADGTVQKTPVFSDISAGTENSTVSLIIPASIVVDGQKKWGWIDPHGNWLIEPKYEAAEPFSEGLAAFSVSPADAP